MSRIIQFVHYDPVWIAAFEKEAAILNAVFGRRIVEVHHIGSTAVPGLNAKPIIDILVVLDDTVHVCAKGHSEIFDKPAFRDYLRAHSSKAAVYGELKRRIATQYRLDNMGYMNAKDGFVKATLFEARRWYELGGTHCDWSTKASVDC